MMRNRWLLVMAGVTVAAATAPRDVFAQGSLELTPWAGAYVPTRNSFSGLGTDIRRDNSFVFGGRLTWWGTGPLGIDLTAGYSPAKVKIAGGTINATHDTKVLVSGLRLLLGLSSHESRVGVYAGIGPALIRRGDDVFRQKSSHTAFGGTAGIGFRFPIVRGVAVKLEAEDYVYDEDFGTGNKMQNDLVLSAGLAFIIGSR